MGDTERYSVNIGKKNPNVSQLLTLSLQGPLLTMSYDKLGRSAQGKTLGIPNSLLDPLILEDSRLYGLSNGDINEFMWEDKRADGGSYI